jgi:hypothetical protein
MAQAQKLARVVALNRSVEQLSRAGIRLRKPGARAREIRLVTVGTALAFLDEAVRNGPAVGTASAFLDEAVRNGPAVGTASAFLDEAVRNGPAG